MMMMMMMMMMMTMTTTTTTIRGHCGPKLEQNWYLLNYVLYKNTIGSPLFLQEL
jgi:hypothetical protein